MYDYAATLLWAFDDDGDGFGPQWSNACAGAWDVEVRPFNVTEVDGVRSSTMGKAMTAARAFSVLRWSRLSTNASPEPARRGSTVTVKGRLTRQVLEPLGASESAGKRFVGYAGQPVLLQRRTLSGAFTRIRTVGSDRHGYLSTKVRALRGDRCYRWVFRGSSTTRPVTAAGDCVHVVN